MVLTTSGGTVNLIEDGVINLDEAPEGVWLSEPGVFSYATGNYLFGMTYLITDVADLNARKGAYYLLNPRIKADPHGTNSSVDIFNGLDDRLAAVETVPTVSTTDDYNAIPFGAIFADNR
jgi:hypothetical protein